MGRLWDLIEEYRDNQKWRPSLRAMAKAVEVSPTAFTNWREPKDLPDAVNLHALSELIGVPYLRVLEAALTDAGYHERSHHGPDAAANRQAAGSAAADEIIEATVELVRDPVEGDPRPQRRRAPRRQPG